MSSTNDDILLKLGEISADVRAAKESVERVEKATTNRLNNHSDRIRSVEASRSRGRGILGTLTFMLSLVGLERLIHWTTT